MRNKYPDMYMAERNKKESRVIGEERNVSSNQGKLVIALFNERHDMRDKLTIQNARDELFNVKILLTGCFFVL